MRFLSLSLRHVGTNLHPDAVGGKPLHKGAWSKSGEDHQFGGSLVKAHSMSWMEGTCATKWCDIKTESVDIRIYSQTPPPKK